MAGETHQLSVREVSLDNHHLTWTTCHGKDKKDCVLLDKVLFTLVPPEPMPSQAPFIICCLKERLEERTEPFQLLLLAAESVPDQLVEECGVRQVPSYLCCGDGHRVDVVVSTKSGLCLSLTFWETVLRPLLSLAHGVFGSLAQMTETAVITQDAESVRRFAHTLGQGQNRALEKNGKSRTIVLLSGDGGVVELLNDYQILPDASRPLIALIPLGTGNALFHSLHKPIAARSSPSPLVLSLRTLFHGVPADLPIFRASFSPGACIVSYATDDKGKATEADVGPPVVRRNSGVSHLYGAVVASYGFHASLVHESDNPEFRAHGYKRFHMVAEELLRLPHPYRATLSTRKPSLSRLERGAHQTHAYILVAAVSNLERTYTISPASRPLDQKLFLVQFGPVGGERTMDVIMKAYDAGKHVGVKWDDGEAVRYDEIDEVVVEVSEDDARWRKFCVDGTIVEVPKGGSMTVSKAKRKPFQILVDARVGVPLDQRE